MRFPRLLAAAFAILALAPSLALSQGAVAPLRLPAGSTGPADTLTVGGTTLSAILGGKAPLASPVFTGLPRAPAFVLDGAAGSFRTLSFQSGGVQRFGLYISPDAESGSNAGSSLTLARHSDTGTFLDNPFVVDRASGRTTLLSLDVPRTLRAGRQVADGNGIGGLIIGGGGSDETGHGVAIKADGLANWLVAQVTKNYNPTEFNVYGAQGQGTATSTSGTNQLTYVQGSPFDPLWIGRTFYWSCATYRVASVSGNTMTVTNVDGSAVSFPSNATGIFHYVRTTTEHIVNVTGVNVTRLSGDPFNPFIGGTDYLFRIGSTDYQVAAFVDKDHLTLVSSAGTQSGVRAYSSSNIYDQISTIRVQKTIGSTEENLVFSARALCEYEIRVGAGSGYGQYYPLRIKNGQNGADPRTVAEFDQGAVTLGGKFGVGPLTVIPATNGAASNRIQLGPAPVGFGPALLARSGTTDTSVPLAIDTQGGGGVTMTGNSFGQTLFQVFGNTGTGLNWIGTGAATVPAIAAQGPGANVAIAVLGKGTEGARISLYTRTADPTTADIPTGQCSDWSNTAAGTTKRSCNVGGTIRTLTYQ